MSHTTNDYDLIVGYLGANPDILPEDRAKIESWILEHSNERRLSESIARIWASHNSESAKVYMPGLLRLLQSVETELPESRMLPRFRRYVWRTLGVASVLVAFVLGFKYLVRGNSEPDMMLITAAGSIGEFTLPDSSKVWLNGNTTLAYNRNFTSGGHRKVKIDGEAYFDVAHNKDCPFIVDMGDMQVEVVGTEFNVRNYAACRTHDIVLREGRIKVNGLWGDKEITMNPDEMLALNCTTGKVIISHTDANNYCRWFEQQSIFDNEPLADILVNISRRYGVDIKIADDVDTTFCLSVTMGSGESLESIMRVLAYLSPISYKVNDNTLLVSAE